MSISSLRSEIASQQRENSALRSKVRAVEAENAAIQNEINQMCNAISSATNSLLDIEHRATSSLSNDRKIMGNSYNVLVDAINIQDDIKEKYLRYKVIERVYKEIHALNNDIRYNLFMYATAKKIAHAFIDNLSFKVISVKRTSVFSPSGSLFNKSMAFFR